MRMIEQDEEHGNDAEVTWQDQQQINAFSRLNARFRNTEETLNALKQEKEALDDLATELELADEDELVLYKVGETFLHLRLSQALKRLEKDQAELDSQMSALTETADDCERQMKALKVNLYAKFGRAINLDE